MADRRAAMAEGERLPRRERLRHRRDFQRCYARGMRRHGALLTLFVHPNGGAGPRFGITASRKVGGAVVRNRVKRRLREIYRRWPRRGELPPWDLVLHVKPSAGAAAFAALRTDVEELLEWAIRRRDRAS